MRKIYVFSALLLVAFASCRKTPKETFKGCLITQVKAAGVLPTGTSLDIYRLQYNDEGKLTKVEVTSTINGITSQSVRQFGYGNGYVVVDHFKGNPGELHYRDSMVVSKENRVLARYTTLNSTSMKLTEAMVYDAAGQLTEMSGMKWDWVKGDISVLRTGNDTSTFEYYNMPYNVGAMNVSYDELTTYGGPLKKRTKTLKTARYPLVVYEYTYQLDKEGKIEKWYERSRDGQYDWTYEYAYDCR